MVVIMVADLDISKTNTMYICVHARSDLRVSCCVHTHDVEWESRQEQEDSRKGTA
jgi:hypothetical protein